MVDNGQRKRKRVTEMEKEREKEREREGGGVDSQARQTDRIRLLVSEWV